MKSFSRYTPHLISAAALAAAFLFFFLAVPYHLFHKEQTTLFLLAAQPLAEYWHGTGALASLAGDFLTQFFYFEGLGPFIAAVVVWAWGLVVYKVAVRFVGRWAYALGGVAVAVECCRLCHVGYGLADTLALVGWGGAVLGCLACARRFGRRAWAVGVAVIPLGVWLFGAGNWSASAFGLPNFEKEYNYAIDSEMLFGRTEKAARLLEQRKYQSAFATYCHNLLAAKQGRFPNDLMIYKKDPQSGLFLPVAPGSDYHSIYAANELWFALGDMTMAEHAAILGMIFSPRHTGARAIKRLAEINLINADDAAALKYLRLLDQTIVYRRWAADRMPGRQTPEVRQWLDRKRQLIPRTDTLRTSADARLSLRHLLASNAGNTLARDYLLGLELVTGDVDAFLVDYKRYADYARPPRLYAEALLIACARAKASLAEVQALGINPAIVQEFNQFSAMLDEAAPSARHGQFENSYWAYFQALMNATKEDVQ